MEYGKQIRQWWESNLWNPVIDLLFPQMGSMLSGAYINEGEKRGSKAYDGTPEWAAEVCTSGMYNGLVPENYKWFKWKIEPDWLNEVDEVKRVMEERENIAMKYLYNSNFPDETKQAFRQCSALGTAIKWREKDPEKVFRFEVLKLSNCVILENRYGKVDTLFRECKWTARNAFKEWGDKCPESVKSAVNSGNMDQQFDFVHAILPRDDFGLTRDDRLRDNKNMPWAEFWIDPGTKNVMAEGGFRLFPASVWRWEKIPGDFSPYGRGPGIKALQDMGALNAQEKMNMVAGEKMVEPAVMIPEGFEKFVNLNPRGRNRYNQVETGGAVIAAISEVRSLPYALDMQERKSQAVRRRFYVDAFLMLSDYQGSADRTVIEIMERKQEKLQILGPMLGTQKIEHLDADLDDIWRMLEESGKFPPLPDIVYEYAENVTTEYESPLLTAQKKNESSAATRVYQVAGVISQAKGGDMEVFDNLDDDETIRMFAEREGAPTKILRKVEDRDARRQARADQAQQQIALEQSMAAVQAAQQLGQISTKPDEPNALTDVVGGMTQQ
jgi:hypothetical protein